MRAVESDAKKKGFATKPADASGDSSKLGPGGAVPYLRHGGLEQKMDVFGGRWRPIHELRLDAGPALSGSRRS